MTTLDEGMAAAMSAAITGTEAPATPAPEDSNVADSDDTSAARAGDSAAESQEQTAGADDAADNTASDTEGGDEAAGKADSESAPDGEAAGSEAPVAGKVGAAPGDKVQPGDKEGTKPNAAEPDPLNDPLPNALKKETKERIQTLATWVKEARTERDTYKRDFDDLYGAIEKSTANAAQYGQALEYIRQVNSGDRAQQEQALDFMMREVTILARALGKPVAGVNLLEGHQDLIDAVAGGQMTMQYANELAGARSARQHAQRIEQNTQQVQAEQTQAAQALTAGKAALNAVEVELKKDPNYALKRPILIKQLKPLFATMHPSRWADAFRHAYNELPAPAAPTQTAPGPRPAAQAAGVGGNTPLRAGNPAGSNGARAAPQTMEEAVRAGIADASRR